MINGLEGIPGSGKSYEAVAFHILPALKSGRKVITNLPLNVDSLCAIDPSYRHLVEVRTKPSARLGNWDATDIAARPAFQLFPEGTPAIPAPENVFTFGTVWDFYTDWKDSKGRGPLFVVDECHVAFPKTGTPDEIVQWFKLHRHFGADVLLITQSFRDINQPIAQLVAMLIKCRKADILGKKDKYIRKVHGGYRGGLIETDERSYRKEFFAIYRSHTQGGAVQEAAASDVKPMIVYFNRTKWAVLALGGALAVWAFWPNPERTIFGTKKVHTVQTKATTPPGVVRASAPAAPASSAASAPVVPKVVEPFEGKVIHITGVVQAAKRKLTTFAVSMNGLRVFDMTSDEVTQAGYTWTHLAYCFGWLEYEGVKRPITCDAPSMTVGRGDKPIVVDQGSGRRSDDRAGPQWMSAPAPVQAQTMEIPIERSQVNTTLADVIADYRPAGPGPFRIANPGL